MRKQWLTDKWWVSHHNFIDEVRAGLNLPNDLAIHDITLRDGEQQAGLVFNKEDKLKIARLLDEMGVHRIEAGMPAVSKEDKMAVKAITNDGLNAKIFAFSRCMKADVDLALECDVDGVVTEIPSSEHIIKHAYKWPLDKAIDLSIEATKYAADHGLYVTFFTIDSTRADLDWWIKIIKNVASKGHMDSLALVDTFGVCSPEAIRYFTKKALEELNKPIEAHFHNDFGLATANTLAAVCEGAEVVHTTVNGIGERMGNADMAEVALALEALYGIKLGLDYSKLYELSKLVENISGIKMPPHKAIVGDNAFTTESGIVVGWWLRVKEANMPLVMYPYSWDLVGQKGVEIMYGKKSGRDSIVNILDKLGLNLSEDEINKVVELVKEEAVKRKSTLSDDDLKEIIDKVKSG
ncbi:MAG: pyruvate carboxyltransferase [Candidatus Heimdallarchaeota archaeon]